MNAINKCHFAGVAACLAVLSTSGCSSVMMHSGPNKGYYSGTRASADVLMDSSSGWLMRPMAAIDLPFSAVMDTLLLPVDYFTTGDTDSPRERVRRSEQANHTDDVISQTTSPYVANSPAQ